MDRAFLEHYNRELQHLREMGGEFAREFPKIASRLTLDEFGCSDPYVERLIESFAFLTARVQHKLDSEFPRFTQSLLDSIYPQFQTPTPSMVISQFLPDLSEGDLAEGVTIPRESVLRSIIGKGEKTACEFRTAHDVVLWPIEILEAEYHTLNLTTLDLPSTINAKAGVRIRLRSTAGLSFSQLSMDSITLYLRTINDELSMRLYEQLFAQSQDVVVQSQVPGKRTRKSRILPKNSINPVGFNSDQSLFPYDPRAFDGYRLLREYFAFPQRYMFVEISGFQTVLKQFDTNEIDVVIPMREVDYELETNISDENFSLFCTPAINLFPKQTTRIHFNNQFNEFQAIPDRTKPLDFEVYQVLKATGYGIRSDISQEFLPIYSTNDLDHENENRNAYFTTHRVPRLTSKSTGKFGARSLYKGTEVFLSLVDQSSAPYRSDLKELSVLALCSNRDLPLQMPSGLEKTDFTMEKSAPVTGVRCLLGPTAPKPSSNEMKQNWNLVNHLTINYLSLLDSEGGDTASQLRNLLGLYSDKNDLQIRKQISGLTSVKCNPITRRIPSDGPIAFGRGLEAIITFDEAAFRGSGVFLLGAILERFFVKCVSINSFVETSINSIERGEIKRWPTRVGTRPTL